MLRDTRKVDQMGMRLQSAVFRVIFNLKWRRCDLRCRKLLRCVSWWQLHSVRLCYWPRLQRHFINGKYENRMTSWWAWLVGAHSWWAWCCLTSFPFKRVDVIELAGACIVETLGHVEPINRPTPSNPTSLKWIRRWIGQRDWIGPALARHLLSLCHSSHVLSAFHQFQMLGRLEWWSALNPAPRCQSSVAKLPVFHK